MSQVVYFQEHLHATYLLAKLVRRDKLECLILNLYAGSEGYSLMIKGRNGIETETFKLPYEVYIMPYEVYIMPYEVYIMTYEVYIMPYP